MITIKNKFYKCPIDKIFIRYYKINRKFKNWPVQKRLNIFNLKLISELILMYYIQNERIELLH